jgi:diguanylate cyclase (GGDEF)-like protein
MALPLLGISTSCYGNENTSIIYNIDSNILVCLSISLLIIVFFLILTNNVKHKKIKKLISETRTDALTQITNRLGFNSSIEMLFVNPPDNFAAAILDLDYFKDINDSMGHDIGDLYLTLVAKELAKSLPNGDFVARLGGDEFAIIYKNFSDINELKSQVRKTHKSINKVHYVLDKKIKGSASVGVAIYTGKENKTQLLKCADVAMYESKHLGKNNFSFFNTKMERQHARNNVIRKNIKSALDLNDFDLYYQPIIKKDTSEIASLEALIRWEHKDLGYISPAELIPVAEKYNLIYDLGKWVLIQACTTASRWYKQGILNSHISINVSPKQMMKIDFVNLVIDTLQQTKLPPNCLQLEISETVFINNIDKTIDVMQKLRTFGVKFALDDFGTGYSSLCYLSQLKFDCLKIDKEFIKDIDVNPTTYKMIEHISQITKTLSCEMTIEGIETITQLNNLKNINYTYAQGYHFSKPRNKKTIEYLLMNGIKYE